MKCKIEKVATSYLHLGFFQNGFLLDIRNISRSFLTPESHKDSNNLIRMDQSCYQTVSDTRWSHSQTVIFKVHAPLPADTRVVIGHWRVQL